MCNAESHKKVPILKKSFLYTLHIAQRSGGTGHGILLTTLMKWKILTHENNLITSYNRGP